MASLGSEVGRDDPVESVPLVWLTASLPTPTTYRITVLALSQIYVFYLAIFYSIYLSIYLSIHLLVIYLLI